MRESGEQIDYRLKQGYDGLRTVWAKRPIDLEKANTRLLIGAELDKAILRDAALACVKRAVQLRSQAKLR